MRPSYRSFFVFSLFVLLASHVATGVLGRFFATTAPGVVNFLDRVLRTLLVDPLGPEISAFVLLALGAFFALWAHMAGRAAGKSGRQERYSTW